MKGYEIGIILACCNTLFMNYNLQNIIFYNIILYTWLEFIIFGYIFKFISIYIKDKIYYYTINLVNKNQSIWTNDYNINMLLPSHFMFLLVTEYSANTDREYLYIINNRTKIMNNIFGLLLIIYSMSWGYVGASNFICNDSLLIGETLEYDIREAVTYYENVSKANLFDLSHTTIISIATICQLYSLIDYNYYNIFFGLLYFLNLINININIYLLSLYQFIYFIEYTINYIKQVNSKKSVNMDSYDFPSGYLLIKRPLFYFNIIFYVMIPCYILLNAI